MSARMLVWWGSYETVAREVAKFTEAWPTPGVLARFCSMCLAQAAQVIPVIGSSTVSFASPALNESAPTRLESDDESAADVVTTGVSVIPLGILSSRRRSPGPN